MSDAVAVRFSLAAQTCRSTIRTDAAARPVEPAVRRARIT